MPAPLPIGPALQLDWQKCQWGCAGMPASLLKRWYQVEPWIWEASQTWGVPAALLAAIAWTESRFKIRAKSKAGAQGLMQFMPATGRAAAKALASKGIIPRPEDFDPYNVEHSAHAGGWYMRRLLQRWGGNVSQALASYNAGSGRIAKAPNDPTQWPSETQKYVPAVLRRWEAMKAILRNCARGRAHAETVDPLDWKAERCAIPGLEPIPGVSGGKRPGTQPIPRPSPSPRPSLPPSSPVPEEAGFALGMLAVVLLAGAALGGSRG